ncbi:MAG: ComF family protein, partial [Bacteroidales bacterium]|nr:ComF family protein [Bacteroidales bacterium]
MKGIDEVLCAADDLLCAAADLAMPRVCIVCGRQLPLREKHLCAECLRDLPLTFNWSMSRNQMADRFNDLVQRDLEGTDDGLDGTGPGEGPESGTPGEPYAYAAALFLYRSSNGYSKITQSLKYHSNLRAGRYFAHILGEKLSGSPLFSDVDLVVPVPLHWTRMWSRGYNQAEVIGKALSRCLGARMVPDLLVRTRRTRTQTHLDIF